MSDTTNALLSFFRDALKIHPISVTEDLIESGRLDSLALVELLFFLEQRFGYRVDMTALDLEKLRSVEAIARMVESR